MLKVNEKYVMELLPALRDKVTQAIALCDQALKGRAKIVLTFAARTIAQQNALYALGRTVVNPDGRSAKKPMGGIVTNAKGGQSIHNYFMAWDFALLVDGKLLSWDDYKDYDGDGVSDWMECVAIFKSFGFQWGGDWSSFIDKPHFQYTFGLTLSQLQAKQAAKDFIPGTQYLNVNTAAVKYKKVSQNVNLRVGAGTEYDVIQVLPVGSKVVEKQRIADWSQVEFGPKTGWVSNKYLI